MGDTDKPLLHDVEDAGCESIPSLDVPDSAPSTRDGTYCREMLKLRYILLFTFLTIAPSTLIFTVIPDSIINMFAQKSLVSGSPGILSLP